MEKEVFTIKSSRKGYVLLLNGVEVGVFTHSCGFYSLHDVVKHLEKYDPYAYKNLDI
jgi:hypothetical protein